MLGFLLRLLLFGGLQPAQRIGSAEPSVAHRARASARVASLSEDRSWLSALVKLNHWWLIVHRLLLHMPGLVFLVLGPLLGLLLLLETGAGSAPRYS